MAYNTNRSEDSRLEKLVNDYLDQYLFNRPETKFNTVEWVTDKERQIAGADIILTSPELNLENAIVDIKSAVKYSNKTLGTYALELAFIDKRGDDKEGWLTDKNKNTQYYLLLYPKSQKYYTEMKTVDDIDSIEYYLVERDKILSYLGGRGYGREEIADTVALMRENYDGASKNLIRESQYGKDGFFFCLTGYLAEQPINIVIKRYVYDRLSTLHGFVNKNGNYWL